VVLRLTIGWEGNLRAQTAGFGGAILRGGAVAAFRKRQDAVRNGKMVTCHHLISALWCRGRESNPHAPCGAQDFKVMTPASCNSFWLHVMHF